MSTPLEGIIRPFADKGVTPTPFTKPGAQPNELIRIAIGFQGSLKTVGYSFSCTMTSKMGQTHKEKSPQASASLQRRLAEAAQ